MYLDDVNVGDMVIADFKLGNIIGSLKGKIVDKWVTDLPYEIRIGVEFPDILIDENFECKGHSCRGNGKDGFCYYLNLNEIKLQG
jgi:hypothetical protein